MTPEEIREIIQELQKPCSSHPPGQIAALLESYVELLEAVTEFLEQHKESYCTEGDDSKLAELVGCE